jgi:hypothetical protein
MRVPVSWRSFRSPADGRNPPLPERKKKKAQPVKTARILYKGASETADARNGRNNALRKLASRLQGCNKKMAEKSRALGAGGYPRIYRGVDA